MFLFQHLSMWRMQVPLQPGMTLLIHSTCRFRPPFRYARQKGCVSQTLLSNGSCRHLLEMSEKETKSRTKTKKQLSNHEWSNDHIFWHKDGRTGCLSISGIQRETHCHLVSLRLVLQSCYVQQSGVEEMNPQTVLLHKRKKIRINHNILLDKDDSHHGEIIIWTHLIGPGWR